MAEERDTPSTSTDLSALGHGIRKQQEGSAERAAYLEELRRKIKAGEYTVDSDALANKILEVIPDQVLPEEAFLPHDAEPAPNPSVQLPEEDAK